MSCSQYLVCILLHFDVDFAVLVTLSYGTLIKSSTFTQRPSWAISYSKTLRILTYNYAKIVNTFFDRWVCMNKNWVQYFIVYIITTSISDLKCLYSSVPHPVHSHSFLQVILHKSWTQIWSTTWCFKILQNFWTIGLN